MPNNQLIPSVLRSISVAGAAILFIFSLPQSASAQAISSKQRTEIEKIIKEYLLANPEILQEAYTELEKRRHLAAVQSNAKALFESSHQVVLGNPKGDVTMVEFFDYNCGFCKRAVADMLELLKTDPKLRIVLKEFPVLGEASVEAARVAVAVRMQDSTGEKYLDFHRKMFDNRGANNKTQALAAAKAAGLDMSRLEKDLASDEVKATIDESYKLVDALGMSGTPTYVVGTEIVVGAVGLAALKEKINTARCGKIAC